MPFICLARNDIPDGTVQVLDLKPNSSQRSLIYEPPGQTKYVNRVQNDAPVISFGDTEATVIDPVKGLRAYLVDAVEPGGLLTATGTVTALGVQAGDTVTVAGVVFTAAGGAAVAANQEFDESGTDAATATSLAAAINDAASQALIVANTGGATAAAAADDDVVTLTASVTGSAGSLTLASSHADRLALSGDHLARSVEGWDNLDDAAEALIARVDAGESLTVTAVNAVLVGAGLAGTELTNAGGSASLGSVTDLLWIMAGREYRVPAGATFAATADSTHLVFHDAKAGSFTTSVRIGDGSSETRENRPVKATYDSTAFQLSLANGHLYHLTNGVTLYPDSDPAPHARQWWQPDDNHAEVSGARVVTVYDDDGSVLG